jgi:hypothetical protein
MLSIAGRRAHDDRVRDLAVELDVVAFPAEGEAQPLAGICSSVMLDQGAGDAKIENERARIAGDGEDWFGEVETLKLAAIVWEHGGIKAW